MADITFTCPNCDGAIVARASEVGLAFGCPHCKKPVRIQRTSSQTSPPSLPSSPPLPTPPPARLPCPPPVDLPSSPSSPHSGCPECGSPNISRCEMVYAQGTSTGTISGALIGLHAGQGGISPSLVGGGSVGTQSQSLIAQYAAPPTAPASRVTVLGIWGLCLSLPLAFVFFLSCKDSNLCGLESLGVVGCGFLIGAFVGSSLGRSHEEQQYEIRMMRWRRTWMCLSCGRRFIPCEDSRQFTTENGG